MCEIISFMYVQWLVWYLSDFLKFLRVTRAFVAPEHCTDDRFPGKLGGEVTNVASN